jgi:hypothetical protein
VSTTDTHSKPISPPSKPKRGFFRRLLRVTFWLVLLVALTAAITRPFLPRVVLWYANRALNQSPLYQGRIGDIDLHLWRGAYSIRNVRISKTTGNVPVPFFAAKDVDMAIEWRAILHRKIVGQVVITEPQLNFVDDPGPAGGETGAGGPWLKMVRDLFPFDINSVRVNQGSVHFRAYQKKTPVDVYLSHLQAEVDDLTNIDRTVNPMLTTVSATGLAMDQAKFELRMKLNPFSYNPTFHLSMRLLGLDITTTNDLIEAYGQFRVRHGFFDLVLDIDSDEGQLTGYIKPLFRNMIIFDLMRDIQEDDPLRAFWTAIVGGSTALVTNWDRNQLGTLIPFTGQINGPQINILATVGNVLRNAFIRAYLPRLEQTPQDDQLQFGAASLLDPLSVGDEQ